MIDIIIVYYNNTIVVVPYNIIRHIINIINKHQKSLHITTIILTSSIPRNLTPSKRKIRQNPVIHIISNIPQFHS